MLTDLFRCRVNDTSMERRKRPATVLANVNLPKVVSASKKVPVLHATQVNLKGGLNTLLVEHVYKRHRQGFEWRTSLTTQARQTRKLREAKSTLRLATVGSA